jgi:hypothetical protein
MSNADAYADNVSGQLYCQALIASTASILKPAKGLQSNGQCIVQARRAHQAMPACTVLLPILSVCRCNVVRNVGFSAGAVPTVQLLESVQLLEAPSSPSTVCQQQPAACSSSSSIYTANNSLPQTAQPTATCSGQTNPKRMHMCMWALTKL